MGIPLNLQKLSFYSIDHVSQLSDFQILQHYISHQMDVWVFTFLTIMNNATVNISVHIFV